MNRLSKKKTFVVTGGLGFIGSHFVQKALQQGHKVYNIDKTSYASNQIDFNNKNYHFIKEDISLIKDLPDCDMIVNFAAESHVDNSINSSYVFIQSNIVGVYNMLEIVKNKKISSMQKSWEYKTPLFLQISTDEVFGDIEEGAFSEFDRHMPSNPYAASKSAAEQLVVAWARTYGIPFIITRTTNNYGPRQHPEKLIPRCITNLLDNKKIPVHGSGSYVRNWIHVEDNVDAILTILAKGKENSFYNIAANEEYSVKEIVAKIATKFNKTFEEVADFSSDRSGADVRYALTYKKVSSLGWKQKRTFDSTIDEIIEFYRTQKRIG
jgi:dTDP-glucose 4,6-dehydratase